jgi:hypothetical protein
MLSILESTKGTLGKVTLLRHHSYACDVAEQPFMTAIITLRDHPMGNDYVAQVMHKNNADRYRHEMGFNDGSARSRSNSPNP